MSKNKVLRFASVGVGAAALTMTMATAAHASGSPTLVDVGGSTSGATHNSLAASTSAISFTAEANPSGTAPMTCSSVSLPGTVTDGSQSWYPSNTFATIDHTLGSWSGCTGLTLNLAVSQTTDWHIGVNGDTATDTDPASPTFGDDLTPGIIPDVHAEVKDIDFGGFLCDFDVDGSVTGYFDNQTQDLTVDNSSLLVTLDPNGTGASCAGQLKAGGAATFNGTFHISDRSGVDFPITLSN